MPIEKRLRETFDYRILGKHKLQKFALQKNAYVPGAQSETHSHQKPRFVFVLRGRFSEIYERKKRECAPLLTIFRPAGERHSEDYYGKGIVCLRVDLEPDWLNGLCEYNVKLDGSADFRSGELIGVIRRLDQEFDDFDEFSPLAVEALMLETAVAISRGGKEQISTGKVPRWLARAKDYIHAEFGSDLTVSDVAATAGVHPVHLARVFRRRFGCTVAEYVRRVRVEFARSALVASNESLAEVALRAGFSDQSSFSKIFKRLMNQTPAEYRAANRLR